MDSETQKLYNSSNEVMPFFYNGNSELYSFIGENFNRNLMSKEMTKIHVKFQLDVNGFMINPEIQNNTDEILQKEIARVFAIVPRWQPGYQNGDFVKVSYVLPIIFK